MRKIVSLLSLTLLGTTAYYAQTGINTPDPGSTLHVNGSFAAQYRAVSTATYAMNATDYHVSYTGTGNATFLLPTAIAGTGNFKGRLYTIKNNTTSTVTINPATSETIGGNTNIALAANQSVQIINTGLTGAAPTWEVIAYNNTASGGIGCVPDYIFATINGNQEGVTTGTNINFNLPKAGSGIAMTNGVFTLKAGRTYELEVNLLGTNFTNSTGGVLVGNWVDASTNAALSSTTLEFYPTTYTTTPNNGISVAKAYITAVSDIDVTFRITGSNGSAQIRGNQSYASIKQLNSCGSGGTSTPGTAYNGSASVTLNGSTFERAALTGDATATANSNTTTVVGIQGVPVASTTPQTDNILSYNGTNWVPQSLASQSIPRQIVSVSVTDIPANKQKFINNSTQQLIISFPIKNFDSYNAWDTTTNNFTVPANMSGTYTVDMMISSTRATVGGTNSYWVMTRLQKSINNGASWTDLIKDINAMDAGYSDNGNSLFWTGNLNVGDKLRIYGQCTGTDTGATANTINLGNLAITKL